MDKYKELQYLAEILVGIYLESDGDAVIDIITGQRPEKEYDFTNVESCYLVLLVFSFLGNDKSMLDKLKEKIT